MGGGDRGGVGAFDEEEELFDHAAVGTAGLLGQGLLAEGGGQPRVEAQGLERLLCRRGTDRRVVRQGALTASRGWIRQRNRPNDERVRFTGQAVSSRKLRYRK